MSCVCIIFSILRNLEKLFSTPTKLLNSGFAAATSLLIDYPNSSDSIEEAEHDKLLDFVKCVHTDCNIISPIEPTYSCSVCSRSLHLQCAGLTKPPKRKWTCADCKDLDPFPCKEFAEDRYQPTTCTTRNGCT